MKEEITVKSIIEIIKSRIVIILSATVLVTLAAAAVTKFYITPKYTSTIKLCVVSDFSESGSTSASNERNTILYVKDLLETCIEALNAGDAYNELNGNLAGLDASYENTRIGSANIEIAQIGNSNVLRVTATTSKAQLSYDACRAFETMAKNRVPTVGEVNVETLDSPVIAQEPSSPSMLKNCLLGAAVGFLLSAVIAIVVAMLDNTVKDGAETARQLNILLLGEIPDIYSAKEREKYYEYKLYRTETGGKKHGR